MRQPHELSQQPPYPEELRELFVNDFQHKLLGLSKNRWEIPQLEPNATDIGFQVPMLILSAVHKEASTHPVEGSKTLPLSIVRESFVDVISVLRNSEPDVRRAVTSTHVHEAIESSEAYYETHILKGIFRLAVNRELPILGKHKSILLVNGILQQALATQGIAAEKLENERLSKQEMQDVIFPIPRKEQTVHTPVRNRRAAVR